MDYLNKELKIVFEPNNRQDFGNRRRFAVGVRSLCKYIGASNKQAVMDRVEKLMMGERTCINSRGIDVAKLGRDIVKLRKMGKVFIYLY